MEDQDKLLRLYTRLEALKNNLSKDDSVVDTFVSDYHSIVDELANLTSSDLSEFKIPLAEVKPHLTSIHYNGSKSYTKKSFCSGSLFFSKLDALMSYFQIKYLSKENVKIGFDVKE